MSLEKLLNAKETPALVIGNGINRFGANAQQNSWDALLAQLAQRHLTDFSGHLPQGISLTEFYDILDLRLSAQHKRKLPKLSKAKSATNTRNLQQQFCNLMQDWRPLAQHHYIMEWARARKAPVLTSNFEHSLSEAIGAKFFIASANADDSLGFTDYYPWEAYFADAMLDHPAAGFGIWHINGMQRYHRSIRLGLSHYMGSVERARARLHKGARRLSAGIEPQHWSGASTWLHILFHRPLVIFGLGLGENEVFFRWLLIERARYFTSFRKRFQPAWYVHTKHEHDPGKFYFLQAVGVQAFAVDDYDALYGEPHWRCA